MQPRAKKVRRYTNTPDVDSLIVLVAGQDQLRCSVVSRDHIGSVLIPLDVKHFGRTEVTNLHCLTFDQNVLWLQISVDDLECMHVSQSIQSLFDVALDLRDG